MRQVKVILSKSSFVDLVFTSCETQKETYRLYPGDTITWYEIKGAESYFNSLLVKLEKIKSKGIKMIYEVWNEGL